MRRTLALALLGVASLAAAGPLPISPPELRSGVTFAGPAVQAMQRDDAQNPAMLWVERGERLWQSAAGAEGRSCASCHGAAASMRGVATRYPAIDGAARAAFERARAFYHERHGQMNLACADCHDRNWGRKLLNETISQGHGTAFPAYRLEWQSVGSLERRLRACLYGIRAEMPPPGAPELTELELYLAWRAGALPLEVPGVRR